MPTALYLVELTVADWPRAVAWYRDTLGLTLTLEDTANAFALFQAGTDRLALKAGAPQPGTTLLAFEVADLDAELQRLSKGGVLPEGPAKSSSEGYRRAVIRDPDGHRLCLFDWGGNRSGPSAR